MSAVEPVAPELRLRGHNRGLVGLLLDGGRRAAYRHLVDELGERAPDRAREAKAR